MALRCNCGYELGIQPHGGSDLEIIQMNMNSKKHFDESKIRHEKECLEFKEWGIFFYNV